MPAFTHCQNPGCSNPLPVSGPLNMQYCSLPCQRQSSRRRQRDSRGLRPGGTLPAQRSAYRITETPEQRAALMAHFSSPEYAQELLDIADGVPSEREPIDPNLIDPQPEPHEKAIERILGFNFHKGRPHDDSTT